MTCDDTLGCELIWMLKLLSHRQSTGVMLLLQHSASLLLALSTCSSIHTDTQITKLKARSLAFSISLWVVNVRYNCTIGQMTKEKKKCNLNFKYDNSSFTTAVHNCFKAFRLQRKHQHNVKDIQSYLRDDGPADLHFPYSMSELPSQQRSKVFRCWAETHQTAAKEK